MCLSRDSISSLQEISIWLINVESCPQANAEIGIGLGLWTVSLVVEYSEAYGDIIKWKHFPRYWSFVRGIHRSPVNSPHKGQWCRALMFSLICAWINGWVNNGEAGDLRRHHTYYDVTVMIFFVSLVSLQFCIWIYKFEVCITSFRCTSFVI